MKTPEDIGGLAAQWFLISLTLSAGTGIGALIWAFAFYVYRQGLCL